MCLLPQFNIIMLHLASHHVHSSIIGGYSMDQQTIAFELCSKVLNQLQSAILGKEKEIELILVAILASGHILIEDVPGTGKTQLVKSLAKTIDGQFRRIQCNPDLLPSDITGVSIFHPAEQKFIFRKGPVHTHVLLADEINRATTKTQSALLEAMEELHVTVDGETYPLPEPFILLATQNSIEFEGTYTLPEAQLDRFMIKISLGYPALEDELKLIHHTNQYHPSDLLQPVISIEQVQQIRALSQETFIDTSIADYILRLVEATRKHPSLQLGISPRATIALVRALKAYAFIKKRDYVIPDDIKDLFQVVVAHRIILSLEARMQGKTVSGIIHSILEQVEVPVSLKS